MTRLLAGVNTTVVFPFTSFVAKPMTNPLSLSVLSRLDTLHGLGLITALDGLHVLSAITHKFLFDFTVATHTRVTRLWTSMVATRHHITTDFLAAPSVFVISIETAALTSLLATVTCLNRAHSSARRTRSSMTLKITSMGTSTRRNPLLAACLSTAVRRNIALHLRMFKLSTPTFVLGWCLLRQILTTRASPSPWRFLSVLK